MDLRGRALYLGMAQDAERWGAVVLTVMLSLGVAVMAATMHATDEAAAALGSDLQDQYQPVLLVMFALVISAVMSGAHLYDMSALATLRSELTDDLTELRSEYRANAEPVLQAPRLDGGSLGFRLLLAMPAATALAIALGS
jgi:hypothetical protein